jgi:hypothetical protein
MSGSPSQEPVDPADQPVDDDFERRQAIGLARFFRNGRSKDSDRWTMQHACSSPIRVVGERVRDN